MSRVGSLALTLALCACALPPEQAGETSSPLFTNGGFETGNLMGWTVNTHLNSAGLLIVPPQATADLLLTAGGNNFTNALTNAVPQSQPPSSGAAAPTPTLAIQPGVPLWPRFGMTSVSINQDGATIEPGAAPTGGNHQGANENVNSILQDTVTTQADIDAADGKVHVRFVLAPELEAAGHDSKHQPYFFVAIRNTTPPRVGEFFTDFNFANQPGVPWSSQGAGATALLYTDWQIFDVVPPDDKFVLGDTLEVEVYASGCQPGGHSGTAYVDGFGAHIPSLAISKTAPTQANIDTDMTYTFTVQNNTSGIAPNVVADEVLPPNTTFVSISATPGAMCVTPAVGAAGTVTCTYGWLNPGASFNFSVTVHNFAPLAANAQGNSTASTNNTLTAAPVPVWVANQWLGDTVYITSGAGAGQQAIITANTATQLTVTPNWTTNPPNGSQFKIVNAPAVNSSATAAGTATTLTDGAQAWTSNQWLGYTIIQLNGANAGSNGIVGQNTATQVTLTQGTTWSAGNPAAGTLYAIYQPITNVVNGNYGITGPTVTRLLGPKRITKIGQGGVFADLSIVKDDAKPAVVWGGMTSYTITVTNNGPSNVAAAPVTDTVPAQFASDSWTCAPMAACSATSGNGNVATNVTLNNGQSAIITVNATMIGGAGLGTVTNTAVVKTPGAVIDPFPGNNASSDQNSLCATLDLLTATKDKTSGGGQPPGNGSGDVKTIPAAIDCAAACTTQNASFCDGSTVILHAVADPNNSFVGWGGACAASGTAPDCTLTLSGPTNVTVKFTACGNGTLDAGEGCDDGANNGKPGDKCDSACKIVNGQPCNATAPGLMGNGSCESGICDTTGQPAPGVCSAPNVCGNGVLEAGEGCDDGGNNGKPGDKCNALCKIVNANPCNATAPGLMGNASCASGICDTTGQPAPGVCSAPNVCGNGVLEAGEGCDDGGNNGKPGDKCNAMCKIVNANPCNATAPGAMGNASCASGICDTTGQPAPGVCSAPMVCGNGVLEAGEGCDDGGNNGKPGDKCNAMCKIVNANPCNATAPGAMGNASCASGICDTTGQPAPGVCSAPNVCGNGVLEAGEGCDDGGNNGKPGDKCDSSCKIVNNQPCNATAPGATGSASCESGLCNMNGGAPGVCVPTNVCGNGILEAGEGCDDGANNGVGGDPCNSMCKIVTSNPCNATAPGVTGNSSCASGICDTTGHAAPGICSAPNVCGNGVLEAGEGCDDGGNNGKPGDPCNSMCKIVNTNPCNASPPGATGNASCASGLCNMSGGVPGVCSPVGACGNGVLEAGEGCDDGVNNGAAGDACDSMCKIVNGKPCNGSAPGSTGSGSCESGNCDMTAGAPGVCAPAGCNIDSDCPSGQWCNESQHMCSPKLPNGTPIPTDGPHMNPTLTGTCTVAAATLVCQSGTCDPSDNLCGLANGSGPCTSANAGTVCRSGMCNPDGTCGTGGCSLNSDCTDPTTPVCDPTSHRCKAAGNFGLAGGGFCSIASSNASGGDALLVLLALAGLLLAFRARSSRP